MRYRARKPLSERFHSKVMTEPNSGCWLWTGCYEGNGYGNIGSGGSEGRTLKAHRLSYEMHVGPIPPGADVLHRCDTRECVNPFHLFLGTQADNMADMVRKGRNARGSTNGHAKLTEDDVRAIRASADLLTDLVEAYGVAASTISQIRSGHRWRHVI